MTERSRQLRTAALDAHLCGATTAAELLFQVLLDTCPGSLEASHAQHYLKTGHLSIGLLEISHDAATLSQAAVAAHVNNDSLLASALLRRIIMLYPSTDEAQAAIAFMAEQRMLV
jgi:hypothetical protein